MNVLTVNLPIKSIGVPGEEPGVVEEGMSNKSPVGVLVVKIAVMFLMLIGVAEEGVSKIFPVKVMVTKVRGISLVSVGEGVSKRFSVIGVT